MMILSLPCFSLRVVVMFYFKEFICKNIAADTGDLGMVGGYRQINVIYTWFTLFHTG